MSRKPCFPSPLFGAVSFAALFAACVMNPAPPVCAAVLDVRIDFGSAVGVPANWNSVHTGINVNGTAFALKHFHDFTGSSVASLTVTSGPSADDSGFIASGTSQSISWTNSKASWVDVNALNDWTVRTTDAPGQLTLSGLDSGTLYNIELLAARGNSSTAKYRVNDRSGEAVFPPGSAHTSSTDTWNSGTDGVTNSGFMAWYNVATDSTGKIIIDVARNGGGGYAFLMGMRLTTAPTTITHGDTSVQMHFSSVGDPGNDADTHADVNRNGYGAVPYRYKMGTYEVSVDQWNAAAAPAAGDITIGVGSPRFSGDQPITEVSWYAAAQYCNWLTSGDKDKGVYTFQYNEDGTEITGVATNRPLATYRYGKIYVLPNENEWYKAAYYDPDKDGTGGYWNYGTQQDSEPAVLPAGGGGTGAVYNRDTFDPSDKHPENVLMAGGASHYGTVGQSGNVSEWIEDYHTGTSGDRVRRGGSYSNADFLQAATWRDSRPPDSMDAAYNLGFRVAELSLLRDVRIDFGNAYKDGDLNPITPDGWNLVAAPGTSIPLKDFNDFTGDPVASVSFTKFIVSGVVQSTIDWSNSEAPWVDDDSRIALYDYIVSTDDPGQITLSGLDTDARYNIELLSMRAGYTTYAKFEVNGLAGEAVFPPGTFWEGSTSSWDSAVDGLDHKGFMRWANIAPNGDGTIIIDADRTTGSFAWIMGMRISLVPEPGAVLLLITGLPVVLARRRKWRT